MKEFLKRLTTLNRRDLYGLVGWAVVGFLIGLAALPVMVAREVYQYYHYRLTRFEWEDVVRYGLVIVLMGLVGLASFGLWGLLGVLGVVIKHIIM